MSGAEHKTHESSEENNLSNLGQTAGGLLTMVGRTTEGIGRGAEEVANMVDTTLETANTALGQVMGMVRGLLRNTLAPLVVLKEDKGFFKKLGNSIRETAVSTVWGNVKSLAVGTVGVTKTLLGAGSGEKWEAGELGVAGLIKGTYHGLKDIVTSQLGLQTQDPTTCLEQLKEQAKESLAFQRQHSYPAFEHA